jgi:hypothetical protein
MTTNHKLIVGLTAIWLSIATQTAEACTAAVISGKATPDGRPMLWKNRDTGTEQNCVKYYAAGKYAFVALVNSASETPKSVWMGTNTTGFSIMNTLSYNLKDKAVGESGGMKNGSLMLRALEVCATVEEFRYFLDTVAHPRMVETNIGVMDANGGAAWFEIDDADYVMFDANDPATAPHGYIVRTNFSFSGKKDAGAGYVRFQEADRRLNIASATGQITPEWLFGELTRSFSNPLMGIDLKDGQYNKPHTSGWFVEQDFIARKKSTSAVVIQGVRKDEAPELTTMWTVIGYPAVTTVMPVWVKGADKKLPVLLVRNKDTQASPLCDAALTLRNNVYSYSRGADSERYFHWELLYNPAQTGYIQLMMPVEKNVFRKTAIQLDRWREQGKIDITQEHALYDELDTYIKECYKNLFALTI